MQDAHSVFTHLIKFLGQLKTLNLVSLFFKYKHQICVNQHQIKIYSKCDKGVWSAFFHCICTGACNGYYPTTILGKNRRLFKFLFPPLPPVQCWIEVIPLGNRHYTLIKIGGFRATNRVGLRYLYILKIYFGSLRIFFPRL